MFNDSRDYYRRPSRTGGGSSQQTLPSIRDVVGDVLEQPVRARSIPDYVDVHTSIRQTNPARTHAQPIISANDRHVHSSVQLPPMQQRSTNSAPSGVATSSVPNWRGSHPHSSPSEGTHTKPPRRDGSSTHSYDVFMSTSSQGLVHQRSSARDDFRQSAKEEAIFVSTGRHACPDCGRRFEKLSHFKSHLISHSGEKPYECPWPGCGKTFSASSNMRRHHRTHEPGRDYTENPTE